jgi:hypothetical protein
MRIRLQRGCGLAGRLRLALVAEVDVVAVCWRWWALQPWRWLVVVVGRLRLALVVADVDVVVVLLGLVARTMEVVMFAGRWRLALVAEVDMVAVLLGVVAAIG